jgi:hypothetical protein
MARTHLFRGARSHDDHAAELVRGDAGLPVSGAQEPEKSLGLQNEQYWCRPCTTLTHSFVLIDPPD